MMKISKIKVFRVIKVILDNTKINLNNKII